MKIFSISQVKNEMDIIEIFVRYHMNIFDGMLIYDDDSTDKTLKILNSLKQEGLNLYILENNGMDYDQLKTVNFLLKTVINKYGADIIVPLDIDEFIVSNNGNPRNIIENMPDETYYQLQWRTYLPIYGKGNKFSLSNLKYIRDERSELLSKVIIPAKLYKNYKIQIMKGSHDIYYDKKYDKYIKKQFSKNMNIVHVPVRSKEQIISKIIIGWLNNNISHDKKPIEAWHQRDLFKKIINKNGKLSDEDLIKIAKEYSSRKAEIQEYNRVVCPFDLSFCKNLDLKYSEDVDIEYFKNIISYSKNITLKYTDLKQRFDYLNEDILKKDAEPQVKYINLLEESYQVLKNKVKSQDELLKESYIDNDAIERYKKENIIFVENYDKKIQDLELELKKCKEKNINQENSIDKYKKRNNELSEKILSQENSICGYKKRNKELSEKILSQNKSLERYKKRDVELSERYLNQKEYLEKMKKQLNKAIIDKKNAYKRIETLKRELKR